MSPAHKDQCNLHRLLSSRLFFFTIPLPCMYVCMCTHMHQLEDSPPRWDAFPSCLQQIFFILVYIRLAVWASGEPSVSASHLLVVVCWHCRCLCYCMGSGNPNSGHQAAQQALIPTKLPPQLSPHPTYACWLRHFGVHSVLRRKMWFMSEKAFWVWASGSPLVWRSDWLTSDFSFPSAMDGLPGLYEGKDTSWIESPVNQLRIKHSLWIRCFCGRHQLDSINDFISPCDGEVRVILLFTWVSLVWGRLNAWPVITGKAGEPGLEPSLADSRITGSSLQHHPDPPKSKEPSSARTWPHYRKSRD